MNYETWFECDTCSYATNSDIHAFRHEDENEGHCMVAYEEDVDD